MVEMQDVEMCVYVNLHTYICWEEKGVVVMSLSATLLQLSSQNDVAKTSGQTPLPTTFLTCMLHGCSILRMISDGLWSGWARDWKTSPPPAWKQQFSLGTCGLYGSGGMIEILRKAIRWTITITFFSTIITITFVSSTNWPVAILKVTPLRFSMETENTHFKVRNLICAFFYFKFHISLCACTWDYSCSIT